MDLSIEQQIFDQLRKSSKILIALPENLTVDALSCALALRLFLNRLQKDVSVASTGFVPENLKFLPGSELVQKQVDTGKSLVISVDTKEKKMDEVSYHSSEDKVHIYLKSKTSTFVPQDLSFSTEKFPVDLVICLEAHSLEDLGKLHEQNAELFFETPKINIDNKAGNEYFGQINLIDITATSVAEILAQLLQKYEEQLVDEDIATCLLAGIAKTNSFQHVQTTPKAFLKASELVSLGGRQQEIIKNIFKTKSLELLKLWGRALARMKTQDSTSLVYSVLNAADFEKAGAGQEELLPVLREFLDNVSGYKIVALVAEAQKSSFRLLAAVHEQAPLDKILSALGSQAKLLDLNLGNYKIIDAKVEKSSLEEAEGYLLEVIKS
jgi:nanoRNase/pAp phosphatase (c-di-AMP/oligoRNAs hydrolase)